MSDHPFLNTAQHEAHSTNRFPRSLDEILSLLFSFEEPEFVMMLWEDKTLLQGGLCINSSTKGFVKRLQAQIKSQKRCQNLFREYRRLVRLKNNLQKRCRRNSPERGVCWASIRVQSRRTPSQAIPHTNPFQMLFAAANQCSSHLVGAFNVVLRNSPQIPTDVHSYWGNDLCTESIKNDPK